MNSELSWADQWDYNTPDPPPQSSSNNDDKKGKDGNKKSFGKKVLSLAWMKDLRILDQKCTYPNLKSDSCTSPDSEGKTR
ncbi:unnamed protein product [Dovyalis caffra]|uniref:Uncharacterized protein n=1 Tax=Dovyalis caffra TaxID=77055 RepID=A0AAV1RF44_9ROSI|nr:unnamed protein product [Dovyalis caffra]